MINVIKKDKTQKYVYDISLDGTVVNALGFNVLSNTDGFNFKKPNKFRYTDDNPYISNGNGRNSVKGKSYTGVDADVAEFEDTYFHTPWNGGIMKMGLGIDEYCDACIQFSRKNYADLMPDGSIKKVGNSIKSRKMAGYLEKFIDDVIVDLLHDRGDLFIEKYYKYLEKIYNYQIPLKDIASKGNIKKEIKEYIADCNTLTKAGSKKSRQAWYELVIKDNINVNVGDTIYYINTGTKSTHSDVKRVTHTFVKYNGEIVELNAKITRELLTPYCEKNGILYKNLKTKQKNELIKEFIVREEDEIIMNCQIVPSNIMDSEDDIMCSDVEGLEYNVEKYIKAFNSRVEPLLVCFSPEIRHDILITEPSKRKYFTKEQSKLVSGFPEEESDQDKYEVLMTPEFKEIEFWQKIQEEPPFIKECGIKWDELVKEYNIELEKQKSEVFSEENEKYLKALDSLTKEDVDKFYNEGVIPVSITNLMILNTDNFKLYFKALPDTLPSTGGDILNDISYQELETVE